MRLPILTALARDPRREEDDWRGRQRQSCERPVDRERVVPSLRTLYTFLMHPLLLQAERDAEGITRQGNGALRRNYDPEYRKRQNENQSVKSRKRRKLRKSAGPAPFRRGLSGEEADVDETRSDDEEELSASEI